MSLPEQILQHAQALPEGGVLSPKEFLHLGSRSAVDQAFTRLVKAGRLLRVARGRFTSPVSGRFGSRAPAARHVVQALAATTGETMVVHGAAAANALGLTPQVPIREAYLTTGSTRTLRLGRSEVVVKKAPRWMFVLGDQPAGAAVRALAWLGPEHAQESIGRLRRSLPSSEWQALTRHRACLPSWMAEAIGREAAGG
ncbi:MAG: hypothetical protein RI988_3792 [Pseudomonadota bacterium]|jgi:hypothetical protein